MNRFKTTMIAAALAVPFMAGAEEGQTASPMTGENYAARAATLEYPWLTFRMTDGTELSVAAEGLSINYNEGTLLLKSATVEQTIATDQVKSMMFTTTASAVEGITDLLTAEAEYYVLSGKRAGRFANTDAARKALPSGAYIVRSNGKTIKVIF